MLYDINKYIYIYMEYTCKWLMLYATYANSI